MQLPSSDLEFICERLADCWPELRNERLFLTGATGFFGIWLLESFAFANDRFGLNAKITILSRDPAQFRIRFPRLASHLGIEIIRGDIKSFSFPDGSFKYVIHAAASTQVDRSPESQIQVYADNIQGMMRALEFASATSAQRFLFTSSGAVYGPQPVPLSGLHEQLACEIDSSGGGSAYPLSKLVAEQLSLLHSQRHYFDVVIARCFAFVGPHLPLNGRYAIGNFLLDAINRRDIHIKGDGTAVRSYLYAADLAVWLWTMLFRGMNRQVYNLGSTVEYSMMELANLISETVGGGLAVAISGAGQAVPAAPPRYVPDTRLARQELQLEEWCSTAEAISRTSRWYREYLKQK
jgi:nucleoside-diphosphate-sugar epimerase